MFFFRFSPATRALQGAMTAATLALALAPTASADETVSQTVPDGGTISTGSNVSAGDPIQMTLTASTGGTITIVKRTSLSRPDPKGGAEEDDSKPTYLGPRFEISGDATIAKAELLIHGASLPESGYLNPDGGAFTTLLESCASCAGFGRVQVRGGVGPDGNLRGEYYESLLENLGGSPVSIDFATAGFRVVLGAHPPTIDASKDQLDALLRGEDFSGAFACSLLCTVSPKVTVSRRVQHALGLKSRVIANDTLKGSTKGTRNGVNQFFTYELPIRASVKAALRRKHVTALGVTVATTFTGPDGQKGRLSDGRGHTDNFQTFYSKAGRFGLNCRMRGISSSELTVAATKAALRAQRQGKGAGCPDVGQDSDGPNEWE